MAVTAPAKPTPPTPPTAPQVTLGGGGSVTQSTQPQSGYQSDAARKENAAREAVARGDGALSKTTQSEPKKSEKNNTEQQNKAEQNNPAPTNTSNATNTTNPANAGTIQSDGVAANGQAMQAEEGQTATSLLADSPSNSVHGPLFWGISLLLLFTVSFVLFRTLMARRGTKGELTAGDIDSAFDGTSLTGLTKKADGTDDSLRGMTPDEVLAKLEAEEQEEFRKARREAQERLKKARQQGKLTPDIPAASVPKTAAREYREQVTAMLPEKKSAPKLAKPIKKSPDTEEVKHFDIRG